MTYDSKIYLRASQPTLCAVGIEQSALVQICHSACLSAVSEFVLEE